MKTLLRKQPQSESRPPKILQPALRRSFFQSLFPLFLCAYLVGAFANVSSAQSLQLSGDLLINLQNVDLVAAVTNVWTNQTVNPLSAGNFTTRSAAVTNLPLITNSYGPGNSLSLAMLNVAGTANNAMLSPASGVAPAEILQRGTVTVEAWIYSTDVGGVSCIEQYGNRVNTQNREFNYSTGGQGAVSGFNADSTWAPQTFPTPNALHYLVYEYDGTNLILYQDGISNSSVAHANWTTTSSRYGVGCGSDGNDPLRGSMAACRVMSGLLTPAQILNNFNLGPLAVYTLVALKPTITPTTNAFAGDTINFKELVQGNGPVTYQWLGDNGTGGVTFTPIAGATDSNYVLNTTGLTPTNYQFEVAVTSSITVTSPAVAIKVNAPSQPIVTANTAPAATSNIFVGYNVNFTTTFIGNQTITYQWKVSTNGVGGTYNPVDPVRFPTGTSNNVALTNLQLIDTGFYLVTASNAFGTSNSTAVAINVQPLSALPQLAVAGDLLVNLRPQDLNTNLGAITTWTNQINGIGDFTAVNGLAINVTNLIFGSLPINALAVNSDVTLGLNSAQQVPLSITGNGAVSVEGWIFPTNIAGNNTVVGYGVQGGSTTFQKEDREFDFGAGNASAISGNFGNLDTAWSGTLTANTWHHVAYTWDGTAFRAYLDGVLNVTKTGANPINTFQTLLVIGGGVAGTTDTPTLRTDPFRGNIATVRVWDGVLTGPQVLNNFIAGPTKTISLVVAVPAISPSNVVFYGNGTVTVAETNVQSLTETATLQWQADNGTGGVTWSNVTGQTGSNYTFNPVGTVPALPTATNYGYRVVATGNLGTVITSAPVTLTVNPAGPPIVLTGTTPTNATVYAGQQMIYTGSFTSNRPITNQWQISTNGGANYTDLLGASDTNVLSTLTLTNLQVSQSGLYRLKASNFYGSSNTVPVKLTVLPASSQPQVIVAGELIVNLESSTLVTNGTVWPNHTLGADSVGDFTFVGTTPTAINVATSVYNFQPIATVNVAGTTQNAVAAFGANAPSIILGSNTCSMEAWVFATSVANNNTAINYGDEIGNPPTPPLTTRALNYNTQGFGAFTGYFGNADLSWNPGATANAWHYIVATYDGINVRVYQDGALNRTSPTTTLVTDSTLITVGCGTAASVFSFNGAFSGSIAAARVETGVLTAAQIANNFAAGPARTLTVAQLAPLTSASANGQLTLTYTLGTLQSAPGPKGPWTNVPGAASPFSVTPSTTGLPAQFYRLQY